MNKIRVTVSIGAEIAAENLRPLLEAFWADTVRAAGTEPAGSPELSVDVDSGRWIVEGPVTTPPPSGSRG